MFIQPAINGFPFNRRIAGTAGGSGATLETFALAGNVSAAEGNSGTTNFVFTVNRAGDTSRAAAIDWAVTGSGASPALASDFVGGVFPSGTVNFAAGETSKTINVPVQGDATAEAADTFTLTLSNARVSASITVAAATGTITDEDTAVADPASILTAYFFDATPARLFTDAGTTPVSADGQAVQQWSDATANNRHMSQSNGGQRPTYRTSGGKAWVEAAATGRYMGATFSGLSQSYTQVVAFRVLAGTGDNTAILAAAANNGYFLVNTEAPLALGFYDGGGASPPVATGLTVGTDYVAVIRRVAGGGTGFIRVWSKTDYIGELTGSFGLGDPDGFSIFSPIQSGNIPGRGRIYAVGARPGDALSTQDEADLVAAFRSRLP